MQKKVNIRTKLTTATEAGADTMETATAGLCQIEKSGVMLHFAEPDNHGEATLVASDGLAQLTRQGDISSRLTFVERRLIPADYSTLVGKIDMSVFTHALTISPSAQALRISLRFSLLQAGAHVADNELEILAEWEE